jgi:hypothetical protein
VAPEGPAECRTFHTWMQMGLGRRTNGGEVCEGSDEEREACKTDKTLI